MKLLIVEDDKHKRDQVARHINVVCQENGINAKVVTRNSYQSGLSECVAEAPDVLILDMTMPTFDVGPGEQGGRPRHFAGRDILRELRRRGLRVPTIIFTGFDVIGEGHEQRTLAELSEELNREYPDSFRGTVFYSTSEGRWKSELAAKVLTLIGHGYDNSATC